MRDPIRGTTAIFYGQVLRRGLETYGHWSVLHLIRINWELCNKSINNRVALLSDLLVIFIVRIPLLLCKFTSRNKYFASKTFNWKSKANLSRVLIGKLYQITWQIIVKSHLKCNYTSILMVQSGENIMGIWADIFWKNKNKL